MTRTEVLSVCFDPRLATTRHEVLARQFSVFTVTSEADLDSLPSAFSPQVVILCHSMSERDCASVASIARRRWPLAGVLALTAPFNHCASALPDSALAGSEGPAPLLATVKRLSGMRSLPEPPRSAAVNG